MYSVGQVANMMDISISTLRYYDSSGVLVNIKRNASGIRRFDDKDLEALKVIDCLKISGMQLKDIKIFMDWCEKGNATLKKRLKMFQEQEQAVLSQMEKLKTALDMIQFKQWYYESAVQFHDESKVKNMEVSSMPKAIQKLFKKTHCYSKKK